MLTWLPAVITPTEHVLLCPPCLPNPQVGQVTGRVYWQYIVAYGVISFVALIVLWSSEQVSLGGGAELAGCDGRFGIDPPLRTGLVGLR